MSLPTTLSDCVWLFLERLWEPEENSLSLRVVEATVIEEPSTIDTGVTGVDLGEGHLIDPQNPKGRFELRWPSYIAYAVRNESFVAPDEYEEHEQAGPLWLYSRSRFLDFVALGTFATAQFPGPFRHYGVVCQDHIIDVVSCDAPRIIELGVT